MTQHTDVAGPSGYGPKVTVRRSCSDCKACNSESYAVQGDSGHYVYCEHPSLPESKYIGDTNWNTPHWCPVSAPTTQPAPQQEAQEPCPSCRNSDIYACTCTFPKSRNTAPQPSPAAQAFADLETLSDHAFNGQASAPPHFGDEAHVAIPQMLLGAACSAIDKKRDGTKVLAELRRYTTGDLSQAIAPAPAAQGDALDAARLDWLENDVGCRVFHLGKSWYTRDNFGMPYRKRASLREAIDAARAAQEGKKP